MDILMVTMRLLHVGLGVFWAGALLFMTFFLAPSVADAGPDGAKVVQAMLRRGVMTIMPIAAITTILSGFVLMWRVSAGFQPAWSRSPTGMTLGIGAVAAIVAFGIGIMVMRPAQMKAAALAATMGQVTDAKEKESRMVQLQGLRLRSTRASQWVAGLLVITVVTMAVARYL